MRARGCRTCRPISDCIPGRWHDDLLEADRRRQDHRVDLADPAEILEWDWVPPATAAQHSCLLIVAVRRRSVGGAQGVRHRDPGDPGQAGQAEEPACHRRARGAVVVQDSRLGPSRRLTCWPFPPPKDWSAGVLLPKAIKAKIKSEGIKAEGAVG
jgi:hypothetical protein